MSDIVKEKAMDLYQETFEKARELSEEERLSFFLMMMAASAAVIRGSNGKEFLEGYLEATLNDKEFGLHPQNN